MEIRPALREFALECLDRRLEFPDALGVAGDGGMIRIAHQRLGTASVAGEPTRS